MFFNEINNKIDMKVKKDCQVIISPLLQSMLGFRQAKFPAGEYASDWVADVKKGLYSLYVYCPLVESRMVGDAQRGHGLGSIFGGLFKAAMPLLKKGAKTLGREALKTGLNIAGYVVQGRNIKQAAQSRLKSTGQNLFQKVMDMVGPPGQRAIKGPAKRKKTRRRQTKQRNTSNDIFG
jgi:hypothetical protein